MLIKNLIFSVICFVYVCFTSAPVYCPLLFMCVRYSVSVISRLTVDSVS